jgi:hypothetical protein
MCAVVAGHKDPSASDRPEIIAETRGYIRDFEAGMAGPSTARLSCGTPWQPSEQPRGDQ